MHLYLGRHKGERVDAPEQPDADAYDKHDAGQRQDGGEKGHQAKMGPARSRRRK